MDIITVLKINAPLLAPVTGRLTHEMLVNGGQGPSIGLFNFFPFLIICTLSDSEKSYQNFFQTGSCLHFGKHLGNPMGYKQDTKVESHTIRSNGYVSAWGIQKLNNRSLPLFFFLLFLPDMNRRKRVPLKGLM